MRKVKGIDVPETLGEAKTLTYKQLEDAANVFNEHAMSAEDIKIAWDNHQLSGFNNAIELVIDMLDKYDSNELARYSPWSFIEKFKEDLLSEVDKLKKDV